MTDLFLGHAGTEGNADLDEIRALARQQYYPIVTGETLAHITSFEHQLGDPRRYGAVGGGVVDDTVALVNTMVNTSAIGAASEALTTLDLGGLTYKMTATSGFRVLPFVHLTNGQITNNAVISPNPVVYVGNAAGGDLVRTAGITRLRVKTRSTCAPVTLGGIAYGVAGVRVQGLCRGVFVRDCFADMNALVSGGVEQYRQAGFEIMSSSQDELTNGAGGNYHNAFDQCYSLGGYVGGRLRTRPNDNGTYTAESNANRFHVIAFSPTHAALIVGPGATDNICLTRGDTFDLTSTDIAVLHVYGDTNDNKVEVWEEIGTGAGVQHTVRLEGARVCYNDIAYHNQGGATPVDTSGITDTSVHKNVIRRIGRPGGLLGGEIATVNAYGSVTNDSNWHTLQTFVATARCILVWGSGVLEANQTGGAFSIAFAKGAVATLQNRLDDFLAGAGTTPEVLQVDPTLATIIDEQFLLEQGDVLHVMGRNQGSAPNIMMATATLRYSE